MLNRVRLFGALACVLACAGCDDDFDPVTRLKTLRVLAIQSDPIAPAPGEATTFRPLIYTLAAEPVLTYAWSWCPLPGPASQGYPCAVSETDLAALAATAGAPAGALPPYDLGAGPTATFTHTVPPALLQAVCGQVAARNGSGGGAQCPAEGLAVQIKLVVTTATDQIVTVRRLRLRLDNSELPNTIPVITGLVAEIGGAQVPIGKDAALVLPRAKATTIRALVPPSDSEPTAQDPEDPTALPQERLNVSWFVESGDVDNARTGFIAASDDARTDAEKFDRLTRNKWTPGRTRDYPASTSRLIAVIRDSRDGVSWTEGSVSLEGAP